MQSTDCVSGRRFLCIGLDRYSRVSIFLGSMELTKIDVLMIMILMKKSLLSVVSLCCLVLVGCSPVSGEIGTANETGTINVVVGVYPYAYMVETLGGDRVSVTNLAEGSVEPHDLELTARQVRTLTTSDLIIYQRGFQPALDAGVEQSQTPRIFDVTTVVPLENSGEGTLDQHIWLDPVLMATIAEDVASLLIEIDPAGEEHYRANLEGLITTLNRLDEDYTQGLATCERREFLVEHAAFGYLAQRYNLTQISVKGVNPDVEPSPGHLAQIYEEVELRGLTTIFYDNSSGAELTPSGSTQSIADDLQLRIWPIDPLEQAPTQQVDHHNKYPDVMDMNLWSLRSANGCP